MPMPNSMMIPRAPASFNDYLQSHALPSRQAEVRRLDHCDITLTLVEHAPCPGIEYAPVDEIIVSVVLRSNHQPVVRHLNGRELRFLDTPGLVLLTPARTPTGWQFDSHPQVLHLSVPAAVVSHGMKLPAGHAEQLLRRAADRQHSDPLLGLMATRLWAAACRPASHTRQQARHHLIALMSVLLDADAAAPAAPSSSASLAPWRLRQALTLMRLPGATPTVPELAQQVGLSADHFRRAFKAATGRSPNEMMGQIRIDQAKHLLCTTDSALTELALELGFSSSAHFSSRFRQLAGCTPGQWRQHCRESL